jgi:hypothetical protein
MFLHEDGWPPDDRPLTKEQVNAEARDLIGPKRMTEFPIPDLMRIANKYPGVFGKLFAAMIPQPRARPQQSRSESMTPTSAEEQHNAWLRFLEICALLKDRGVTATRKG